MQTYYDVGQRKWVTRLPDGTVRAATYAEATLAFSNGAQAPIGSSSPAPDPAVPSPIGGAPGSRNPPPDTGQPGTRPIANPRDGTPGAPPPDYTRGPGEARPPALTPPPPDWRTQQSWWGSLFPTDTLQRTAYDLDPNFAWNTLVNHNVANSASPEYSWLQGQQSRDYALYADQNTRANGTPQGNMTFADWIEQNAPTFHQQFQQLSPNQKGYTDYFNPAGRVTW